MNIRNWPKWRMWLARLAGGLGIALATGCVGSAGEPQPLALTAAPALAPVPIPTGPALWRLTDADTTIYLFGTVHALPEGANWYDARIQRAFAASEELVTEIDMGDQTALASTFAETAMLSRGRNLRELMTFENRAQYENALTALGVPVEALDPVEPWYAALNLTILPLIQSGYNPNSGVDQVLTAAGAGKRRAALETVAEQAALFDGLPMDAQLTLLDAAVEGVDTAASSLDSMVDAWLKGDAEGLASQMNSDMDDPALSERLLYSRNARWADWIETRLQQPGTVFIAVGAGHLAGRGSLQELLGARGREVERVWQ